MMRSLSCCIRHAFVLWVLFVASFAFAQEKDKSIIKNEIDWPSFMSGKAMIWKKAPTTWDNAPFMGNGLIGMQVRQPDGQKKILRLEVARMDAQERLPMENDHDGAGNWAYKRYRLPIGAFVLEFKDDVTEWDLKLDLYTAQLSGTITAGGMECSVKAFAHATQPLLFFEMIPAEGYSLPSWNWEAYSSVSPRTHSWSHDLGQKEAPDAKPGPPGSELRNFKPARVWKQPTRPSGEVSTAWREVKKNGGHTLYTSIIQSFPDNGASRNAAAIVNKLASARRSDLENSHLAWWRKFYPEAFVSVPDAYWDAFYWTQIYKIGSGMRKNGPVLDLQGPWTGLPVNSWPGVWWNLNVQLTYWPCYTGNRLDAATSLSSTLKKYRKNLIENVKPEYRSDSAGIPRASGPDARQNTGIPDGGEGQASEVGSLAWTCHNLFTQYRMTMDDTFLREDVFPLLRRAVNYYLHFLKKGDDGKWHLPPTLSPEYRSEPVPDCNYDLALLKWGCRTLLWSTERLSIKDPLENQWRDIVENLVDFPVDENGYMVGAGVPFKHSHRHYSHLFMVYPLHITDTSIKENADLMDKSIRHWHSLKGGLQGYSFTGGASLYATLLRGDEALEMLDGLKRYLRPNTLYKETFPVIETPLSGAASIHDMLLQSWNDVVNVLPAVPSEWRDVVIHDLRAEGAFLVSAERRDGSTKWVRVKSLAGESLRLRTGLGAEAVLTGTGSMHMNREDNGDWVGVMPGGSEILLALPGEIPVVKPVSTTPLEKPFGLP